MGFRRRQRRAASDLVAQAEADVEAQRIARGSEAPETQKALFALARAYLQTRDFISAKATADTVYAIHS